jgi:hypothetical protein
MKKSAWPLLVAVFVLSGCANHYVLRLNNGEELTTPSKPKLKNNVYYYKDVKGFEHSISQGRVIEIEPASVAKEERKPKPSQPAKKKKWYLLWLA